MSGPGLPPEVIAAMTGPDAGAGALPPELPSAGGEAVAQSAVAKNGLAAFERVQALGGGRPEADDLKAILMYVLTEGTGAPSASDMIALLQKYGVSIPGVSDENADF